MCGTGKHAASTLQQPVQELSAVLYLADTEHHIAVLSRLTRVAFRHSTRAGQHKVTCKVRTGVEDMEVNTNRRHSAVIANSAATILTQLGRILIITEDIFTLWSLYLTIVTLGDAQAGVGVL